MEEAKQPEISPHPPSPPEAKEESPKSADDQIEEFIQNTVDKILPNLLSPIQKSLAEERELARLEKLELEFPDFKQYQQEIFAQLALYPEIRKHPEGFKMLYLNAKLKAGSNFDSNPDMSYPFSSKSYTRNLPFAELSPEEKTIAQNYGISPENYKKRKIELRKSRSEIEINRRKMEE